MIAGRRGVLIGVFLLLLGSACSAPREEQGSSGRTALAVGVLGTSCRQDRAAAEAAAGIRLAVLDVPWGRYEPVQGQFDQGFATAVRQQIETCEGAGVRVVLAPGLQYPPSWVLGLPDGTYRDQRGATPSPPVANLVFSAAVRSAAAAYLTRLATDLGLRRFAAVRIGTSSTGELSYPAPDAGEAQHSFWAFDDAARTGQGLPFGTSANPLPGWVPGGSPLTAEQAAGWYRWYTSSLAAALTWQVSLLRGLGFDGEIHVPTAGHGVLPDAEATALAGGLDQDLPSDGSIERGFDGPTQFRMLADVDAAYRRAGGRGPVVIDVTGLDDVSAVHARAQVPPQDNCQATDVRYVDTGGPEIAAWPVGRWTIAVARSVGLPVVGENPGPPDRAFTGGTAESDDLPTQLVMAPRYAAACGLTQFYWAFEDTLFDGRSGVGVRDLAGVTTQSTR